MCAGLALHKCLQPLREKPCLFFHILDLLMSKLPCFVACGMTEIPREMWWFMHRAYIYRTHDWIHWVLTAVKEGYLHFKSVAEHKDLNLLKRTIMQMNHISALGMLSASKHLYYITFFWWYFKGEVETWDVQALEYNYFSWCQWTLS